MAENPGSFLVSWERAVWSDWMGLSAVRVSWTLWFKKLGEWSRNYLLQNCENGGRHFYLFWRTGGTSEKEKRSENKQKAANDDADELAL